MNNPKRNILYSMVKGIDFDTNLEKFQEILSEFKAKILEQFPIELEDKDILLQENYRGCQLTFSKEAPNPNFDEEMRVYNEWIEKRRQEKLERIAAEKLRNEMNAPKRAAKVEKETQLAKAIKAVMRNPKLNALEKFNQVEELVSLNEKYMKDNHVEDNHG